ncbi:hypothetical protein L0152_05015 [bacterium]|nr:hypothetical protein [bacterium]
MKTNSFLLGAVLAAFGLVTLYRCSLLTDLQNGMNRYVKDKSRLVGIHTFFLRLVGLALIIAAIIVWVRAY